MIRKQLCPLIGNRCPCISIPGDQNAPFRKRKCVPEFGLVILALPSSSLHSSAASPSSPASLLFFPSFVGGVFHCSWIRGSVWQPPLLPLGRVLPPYKRKGGKRRCGGVEERARPLFLTLVRKASLLLAGHRHLLITIETLWEVFPLRCFLCSRSPPPPAFRSGKQALHGLVYWDRARKTNKQERNIPAIRTDARDMVLGLTT